MFLTETSTTKHISKSVTAPERRKKTRNRPFSCHSTAEMLSITTCHKADDENSSSFHLGPDSFLSEVLFNKTPFSAIKTTLDSHHSLTKICLEEGLCTMCGLCAATLSGFSCPGLLMPDNEKTNNQPKAGLLFSSCSTSNPTQHSNLSCLAQQEQCFSTSPIA